MSFRKFVMAIFCFLSGIIFIGLGWEGMTAPSVSVPSDGGYILLFIIGVVIILFGLRTIILNDE